MVAILKLPAPVYRSRGAGRPGGDARARQPWVARIVGFHRHFEFSRQFIDPMRDYRDSNKRGTSGIYAYYLLSPGDVYEVHEIEEGFRAVERRYFVRADEGRVVEIDRSEVYTLVGERVEATRIDRFDD